MHEHARLTESIQCVHALKQHYKRDGAANFQIITIPTVDRDNTRTYYFANFIPNFQGVFRTAKEFANFVLF